MDPLTGLMRRAVELAVPTNPHPNPRVGALVVDSAGHVLGRGAHPGPGQPHAERIALDQAGDLARGATLVVTLEPCDHHGRTPPCTDAIVAAGVAEVVVGATDPDHRVSGRGLDRLRAAGVAVIEGVETAMVEAMDPGYFHHRRTGRAWVLHKAAITLDGQIAAIDGTSRWVTGEEARRDAHRLRAMADGVLVGAGTLIADDPTLTVRLDSHTGHQPRPVVVAGTRALPVRAAIWERQPLVVATAPVQAGGDVVVVPGKGGRVDLEAALRAIADHGILSVLVEGGAGISGSLYEAGLIDAGVWYVAAKLAGGIGRGVFDRPFATMAAATPVEITGVTQLGGDVRIDWLPIPPPPNLG